MPKKVQPAGSYWHLKVRTLKVNGEARIDGHDMACSLTTSAATATVRT
jgi:hypothetical protein